MKTTEQEMAGILGVLNGRTAVFEEEGDSNDLLPTDQVAACLLGKTVQQMVQDASGKYELPEAVTAPFEPAHAKAAEVAQNQSVPYYVPLGKSKRLPGRLISGLRRAVRRFLEYIFAPILQQQNMFNAATARAIEENIKSTEASMEKLRDFVAQNYYQELKHELVLAEKRCEDALVLAQQRHEDAFVALAKQQKEEMQTLQNRVERGYVQINRSMMNYFSAMNVPLAKPAVSEEPPKGTPPAAGAGAGDDTYAEIDYLAFENAFRGSEEDIQKNQESYLPYLAGKQNIVDVGCGRGEFLELLRQNKISARGVDTYPAFVEMCQNKGLQAQCMDGITYLESLEDNSLGGVTAFQVAEHLPSALLVQLVEVAHKKLAIGGVLILETPNPTNLSTFTNAFYVDPSHIKPVHPATLSHYAEMAGFREVKTLFTQASRSAYRLPLLNAKAENLAEFNDGINVLNEKIFGSQDYAMIATK